MKFSPLNLICSVSVLSLLFVTSVNAGTRFNFALHKAYTCDTIPPKDSTGFKRVEKEAYFIGGDKAWIQFLSENINSKVPVKKKAPAGRYTVLIQFIVRADGTVGDVEALTNVGYGMEEEAIRVIKKSPLWVPAVQDGKKVNAYRKQPLTFSIEGKEKKSKDK
ncbi:MAG: energy transducer TonB [Chitinophagaceae bacterium]|nr:energy transducer TonB [Chitinophagaceae bacterium]